MRVRISRIAKPRWGISFAAEPKAALPLVELPPPTTAVVPLQQHIGVEAEALVAPGDRVFTGQPVGEVRRGALGARVHAPVAGTVREIGALALGPARHCTAVTIDSDGSDERWPGYRGTEKPLRLSTSALRQAIIEGGIVGLGGATFPAGVKLNRGSGVGTLILNGVECEPVMQCDAALMTTEADAMLRGAQIMLRILEADECIVAIKADMAGALDSVVAALEALGDDRFRIALLPAVYPAGGEAQLIQLLTGRELPAGGLPWDSGAICQNVATAAAVHRFLSAGEPLISRIVTVTGALASPLNVRARIGTPVAELLAAAGGLTTATLRLIAGGPMMGHTLHDTGLPVTKASNCIFAAAPEATAGEPEPAACIRCGDCATVCPASLMPQLLLQAGKVNDFDRLEHLGLSSCIECGCCDYVCPSRIPLTLGFERNKQQLWEIAREKRRAAQAGRRSEARTARLQREERERAEALQQQTARLSDGAQARDELKALLERRSKGTRSRSSAAADDNSAPSGDRE